MKSIELRGVPRYVKLAESLRRDIARGKLKPGDRLPSFAQTKARHGVSQATWDKVHATLESEGLISREPGRGVFVTQPPDAEEKPRATGTIGLAGYGFGAAGSSTYWAAILDGVRKTVEAAGKRVILLPLDRTDGWENADGALVCNWTPAAVRRAPDNMPLVWLLAPLPGITGVRVDDERGIADLTNHLLALGHRRIAYLHSRGVTENSPRLKTHLETLRAAGIKPDKKWRHSLPDAPGYGAEFIRSGHAAMAGWLDDDWDETGCTAIIAHNDETAIGVIGALREAGLRVPEDVSVAGFDGLEIGAYFSPSLTTVAVPLREIGARAAALLLEEMKKSKPAPDSPQFSHEHIALPCVLQERASTAPLAATPPPDKAAPATRTAACRARRA